MWGDNQDDNEKVIIQDDNEGDSEGDSEGDI